jgi:hypothetical protein
VLIVIGSGDTLAGLEDARWNYEAARGILKNWLPFESVNQEPKRMKEAKANHVSQSKEKEIIDKKDSRLLEQT